MDVQDCSALVFSNIFRNCLPGFLISPNSMFHKWFWFFLNYFGVIWCPKIKYNWCWKSCSRPLGPTTMNMMSFRVFLWWIRKITSPKWSGMILRSFWAILWMKFTVKMPSQTPQTPSPDFSLFFPDSENRFYGGFGTTQHTCQASSLAASAQAKLLLVNLGFRSCHFLVGHLSLL